MKEIIITMNCSYACFKLLLALRFCLTADLSPATIHSTGALSAWQLSARSPPALCKQSHN